MKRLQVPAMKGTAWQRVAAAKVAAKVVAKVVVRQDKKAVEAAVKTALPGREVPPDI